MRILDTTLRDGSYVINFQFSAQDTKDLASELDAAGIDLIEIGHGVGIGGSVKGHGLSRETDRTYMQAAAQSIKRAKWGMFAIPGICELADLDSAAAEGMGFIRIGVSVDKVMTARPFIEKAKSLGMLAAVNFMKSYVKPPEEFAQRAKDAAEFGADLVYVVDSAGSMTPQMVRDYVQATKAATNVSLGFHGHNNLGLAMANALEALSLGCDVIDCSLQGMGRSAGNTMTEHFVGLLDRLEIKHSYDFFRLLDAAENLVRPRLEVVGHDTVDLICGYAGFHSSYMNVIRDAALSHDVDPRKLIVAVCSRSQADAPKDIVDELAAKIASEDKKRGYRHRFPLRQYFGHEQDNL